MIQYSKLLLQHFYNPCYVGTLDESEAWVGTGFVEIPNSQLALRIQIRLNSSGIVETAKFKALGCPATIGLASWLSEWLHGKTLFEVDLLTSSSIISALNLPSEKHYCAFFGEETIKQAVASFKSRQKESVSETLLEQTI